MPEKAETRENREDAGQIGQAEAKPKKRIRAAAEALATREAALDRAALQFKALGDPTRLRIVRLLAGDKGWGATDDEAATTNETNAAPAPDGWTVGDVSAHLFGKSKVSSTLSHHLKELRNAQLITMKRRGKNLICRVQEREVAGLRCYLAVARAQAPSDTKRPLREGESRLASLDHLADRNDTPAV